MNKTPAFCAFIISTHNTDILKSRGLSPLPILYARLLALKLLAITSFMALLSPSKSLTFSTV